MNPAMTTGSRRTTRRLVLLLASLGLAATLAGMTAGATLASDAPVSDFTYTAYASVDCDASTARMGVTAMATTWQGEGFLMGWVPTAYDAGQYMSYTVLAREVGQTAWTTVFSWSPWQLVRSMRIDGEFSINTPTALGTSVVQGVRGHDYEVRVQVDFWTGAETVVEVPVTYNQTLTTSPYSTYFLNPSYCHL
jgi:hypothetical protein